ncbi:dihydropteroate synthase [Microbacterium oleivorans]|uniref:Dihydropteroate synthase n=1 Tax=Microbacterium oleivorans TaxID=273677 RepID=A0A177K603_9MICO|nr:dihydropteroate synthase [Microbacterium oleivorans]OAH48832.1 dihydropteroate synthase [Microbacterium oleivorans]
MTLVMGVVNVTPDSFSDGGRYASHESAIAHGRALRHDGADVLDIGGESTRPGAQRVAPEEEQSRILPVVEALAADGATISVDTMNASTAASAVAAGARIVNDVSGGLADADMLAAVAGTDADIVLQHWRGHSADMYGTAVYDDIVGEVVGELGERVAAARAAGIPDHRIVVDPGFGFGKTPEQNWQVVRGLDRLLADGHRVLIGTSRKRMLAVAAAGAGVELAGQDDLDLATAVTSVLAAQAGVWAVRVHDVAATRLALAVRAAWEGER